MAPVNRGGDAIRPTPTPHGEAAAASTSDPPIMLPLLIVGTFLAVLLAVSIGLYICCCIKERRGSEELTGEDMKRTISYPILVDQMSAGASFQPPTRRSAPPSLGSSSPQHSGNSTPKRPSIQEDRSWIVSLPRLSPFQPESILAPVARHSTAQQHKRVASRQRSSDKIRNPLRGNPYLPIFDSFTSGRNRLTTKKRPSISQPSLVGAQKVLPACYLVDLSPTSQSTTPMRGDFVQAASSNVAPRRPSRERPRSIPEDAVLSPSSGDSYYTAPPAPIRPPLVHLPNYPTTPFPSMSRARDSLAILDADTLLPPPPPPATAYRHLAASASPHDLPASPRSFALSPPPRSSSLPAKTARPTRRLTKAPPVRDITSRIGTTKSDRASLYRGTHGMRRTSDVSSSATSPGTSSAESSNADSKTTSTSLSRSQDGDEKNEKGPGLQKGLIGKRSSRCDPLTLKQEPLFNLRMIEAI